MKKILKQQTIYRCKCPYCDCEFEYDKTEIVTTNFIEGKFVSCPSCNKLLSHDISNKSLITTEQL